MEPVEEEQAPPTRPLLEPFGPNIWKVEGPIVNFYGAPYPTRMVICKLVDLEDGDKVVGTWIWSPIALTPALKEEMTRLDLLPAVAEDDTKQIYIVSPNMIHHIFLKPWQEAFPQAKLYAPPGLKGRKVVQNVTFHDDLSTATTLPFSKEISHVIVKGSCFMEEVVFYHQPSKTAIVGDLIQRFDPGFTQEHGGGCCMARMMKWDGLVGPQGSTPREWRLSFWFGKAQARQARDVMIQEWKPKQLIIAHGECVKWHGKSNESEATDVIATGLSWLDKCHSLFSI